MDEQTKTVIEKYELKIQGLRAQIEPLQKEVNKYKLIVNQLLIDEGESAKYEDSSEEFEETPKTIIPLKPKQEDPGGGISVRTGEFYNRPLAKAARIILERAGGTMLFSEIIENLNKGGFPAKDEKWVRLTLLKNKHFDILPDRRYMIFVSKGKSRKGKATKSEETKQ